MAHNRSDYPELDPDLQVNFLISREDGRLTETRERAHAVLKHLEQWAKVDEEHEVAGRLLE